jgi:hypothetical protein
LLLGKKKKPEGATGAAAPHAFWLVIPGFYLMVIQDFVAPSSARWLFTIIVRGLCQDNFRRAAKPLTC